MMKQLLLNEWKRWLQTRVLIFLSVLFLAGLVTVTWLSVLQNKQQQKAQQEAKQHVREQWESIEAMNPHSAAHFGSYAFKPSGSLHSIDEGVQAITGNVLRLEGHVQNELAYSEVSQSLSVSRFGKLKPSLLLQYVIPLFLIFLAFSSLSAEKESGRLKLLVFQGASLSTLIYGKAFSVWFYGLLLLLFTIGLQLLLYSGEITVDQLFRLAGLFITYGLYYYIISLLTCWLSAQLKNGTATLSSILAIWILWTIFLPGIWAYTGSKLHPLPNRKEFKAGMQEDRSKGLDGHQPSDQRAEAFKQKILQRYKVEKVEDLPINYDGLRMQEDESYGNRVWDKHFGNNDRLLQQQKRFYQLSGSFNPFASLQSTSMGLSGSDMYHHLDFLHQAEQYRRTLIRTLNEKQAYGGSKTGDWEWKEQNAFYKSIPDFEYVTPPLSQMIYRYLPDLVWLMLWASVLSVTVLITSKKISLL